MGDDNIRGIGGGVLAVLIAALTFCVLGFASPAWSVTWPLADVYTQTGLWHTAVCTIADQTELADQDWFKAVQATACIALIALAGTVACMLIFLCCRCKTFALIIVIIGSFISMVMCITAVSIYGANKSEGLHWSFAMIVIAGFFSLFAGGLAIVQVCK